MASIRHQLLVAQPMLRDPNFNRTVVYMIEHTDDGALGVVLNRPGPVGVGEFLPDWEKVATEPRVLFKGGPVGQNSFVGLAVSGGVVTLVDLEAGPDAAALAFEGVRVFNGYAGWGPGQLDGELALGGWFVLDSAPGDLITEDPERLFRDVLRRQGGRFAMLANCPSDLRLN